MWLKGFILYLQISLLMVIRITVVSYHSSAILMVLKEMHESLNPFSFIAGALCLDFVNTVGSRICGQPRDKLRGFADLIRWSKEAGLIQEGEALDLLAYSEADSNGATKILEEARGLREALFRIFEASGRREAPDAEDLATLNQVLRALPVRLEVCSDGK